MCALSTRRACSLGMKAPRRTRKLGRTEAFSNVEDEGASHRYGGLQGQANEVMRLVCQADAGSFVLSFRGDTSGSIPFNASYGYVESLLEEMDTINDVLVDMPTGEAVCGQSQEVVTRIEFLQDFGPLPAALVR